MPLAIHASAVSSRSNCVKIRRDLPIPLRRRIWTSAIYPYPFDIDATDFGDRSRDHWEAPGQASRALDAGIRLALDFYVHGSRLR